MQGIAGLAVTQVTREIASSVAWRAMRGIAGRVNWTVTLAVTCPAPDLSTVYSLLSTAVEVTSETAQQTMSETTFPAPSLTTTYCILSTICG